MYFRAVTLLCNIWEGDPYVRHMFCNADFLTFAAWGNLIYSSLCFPPTNAAKGNSGLGSHIFWLWLPFYSDEKQTCRMRNEDKERERGKKFRVCQGRAQGLWYELPWEWSLPLLGVWLSLLAPTPAKYTHTVSTECCCYLCDNGVFHSDTLYKECPRGISAHEVFIFLISSEVHKSLCDTQ